MRTSRSTSRTEAALAGRPDATPTARRNASPLWVAALVLVACSIVAAVHWPVLSAQAVWLDENKFLFGSRVMQRPGWASAVRVFSEVLRPSTVEGYYEPLTQVSLMLDVARGGSVHDLRAFHETSLGLHVANTGLLVLILYLLFGRPWIAAIAGVLWGVHPLCVEPLAWVWERKTVLATFWCLVCVLFYVASLRRTQWAYRVAMTAAYLLALLSKPISIPLPFLLLAMDYWPLRRLSRRSVIEKLPLLALAAISTAITLLSVRHTSGIELSAVSLPVRLIVRPLYLLGFYAGKVLWPASLAVAYTLPEPMRLTDWRVAAVVCAAVAVLAIVFILRRRYYG